MPVIAGYVRKKDPRWPYIIAFILIALIVWLVVSLVSCVSDQLEDRIGKVEVKKKAAATTINLPKREERPAEKRGGADLTVSRFSFSSQITAGNLPGDNLDTVDLARQGKVYCCTRVENQGGGETIHHVWLDPEGEVVADIPLNLHNQPADTWSFVTVSGYNPGKWEVQVKTAGGQVIASKSFTTTVN